MLCKPAKIYLVFSIIIFIVLIFQNYGNLDYYCLGKLQCESPDLTLIYIIKALYVTFWTFVIQCLCDANQGTLAWLLVLFPIVLYIILFIDLADG
jgi:hypothetical protein